MKGKKMNDMGSSRLRYQRCTPGREGEKTAQQKFVVVTQRSESVGQEEKRNKSSNLVDSSGLGASQVQHFVELLFDFAHLLSDFGE
ncbi:unnamed protein product [Heligmosomoides polygyrus]|uniref:Ovule protein n=1 Tax=Heligmosomoides polygyrus TaxID=6339 RepID=A0A183GCS1_HELPZ|nr:unnamed protein product [Heligmosomoides polygyrus]